MYKNRDNYDFLTSAPVHKVIHSVALPTIASMLITNLYNMADTFFVGHIDTQSTAAVGVVFPVMSIIQSIGFFFGHGSGNYISQQLGARHAENARRMASTGFFYSVGFGCVLMAAGLCLLTPISVLLGSTPTILPYTERYLGIILLGVPFMTGSLTLNNQMRFQGNAVYAMYGILSGAVLNMGLDPLFIFVLGMGVSGAACATLVSQICSFVLLLFMSRRSGNIPVSVRWFTFSPSFLKEICMGGTPSLLRQGLGSFATILLNVAAGAYGDAAIAGMSIVNRISFFVYSAVIGLGQGFQPLCGFCYGAKLYARVREGFVYCVKLGTVFLTACAVVGFIFSGGIIGVFRDDPAVIEVGVSALRWQLVAYPLVALIVTANMLLQTIRKTGRANLVAAARSGLFFIPLIIILPHFFGVQGVEMCQAVSDVCSFAVALPIVIDTFRKMGQ